MGILTLITLESSKKKDSKKLGNLDYHDLTSKSRNYKLTLSLQSKIQAIQIQ
ncbi:hypothetical protein DCO58_11245 [Helicobacter saguini]|uniref:Uncharacterized protein n=1 Tax=Helicobacter saguini TaxID=1548018 RepID=A0A6B0HM96_9HELI|nr:hypothetical protein [Helicobacter saguini]MWV61131.1 hypothetical protein [Helicobacter saguini]MWV68200.1 hypothetical protein [Helicobacter saguini]MWV70336.1 hypothetical protein [Helicobacter saguini]MWV72238.1 hypothetical protein [Helicobacter saguini]